MNFDRSAFTCSSEWGVGEDGWGWGGGGGGGRLNDFKFGTFIGRFPSDGSASRAVKGLKGEHDSSIRLKAEEKGTH